MLLISTTVLCSTPTHDSSFFVAHKDMDTQTQTHTQTWRDRDTERERRERERGKERKREREEKSSYSSSALVIPPCRHGPDRESNPVSPLLEFDEWRKREREKEEKERERERETETMEETQEGRDARGKRQEGRN